MKTRLTLLAAASLMVAANGASAATAAGTQIINKASATYTDSTGTKTVESNTVVTTVQLVASLTLSAGTAKNAGAGTQVSYPHTVTNTGNGADTFNLSQTGSGTLTFTGVQFFLDADGNGQADNATPITNTGSLPAGGTFKFVAVATLPAGATTGTTNAMIVKATSATTGSVSAQATDTTTVSAGAVIDITANSPGAAAPGAGQGVEAAAVETKTTTAGVATSFVLYLNNTGGSPETFNLQSSTDATFGTQVLPTGWTVVFKDANGQVITNATVAAGGNVKVTAEVTPATGAAPGTTDVYFRAISTSGTVSDRIHEAVTVAAANSLLELVKMQALDANCDGTPEMAFTVNPITTGAIPGACIRYQITATNKGATTINTVSITDDIPANTTYFADAGTTSLLGAILAPLTNGMVTTVTANGFNLNPGQANTMTFSVKINP